MLIPDSAFTWAWVVALAVALPPALYLKLTGWVRFRRGEQGVGFVRVCGAFAIVAATSIVFINIEKRGNYVWVYKDTRGLLTGREFILFGKERVPMRDSKSIELVEAPRSDDVDPQYILNDAGRALTVTVGYPARKQLTLESGLLLKTTDFFFGDAESVK